MSRRAHVVLRVAVRVTAIIPVLAALTVVGSASKLGPVVAGCAQAATTHHAAFVAEHADGTVVTRCVTFTGDSITGDQLLTLAGAQGVEYATESYGGSGQAVCEVDYEPRGYTNCLGPGSNWTLFVSRAGGPWIYSNRGISSQAFSDGDAEGFHYTGDDTAPSSPRGVCPTTTVAPTPTRSSTASSRRAAVTAITSSSSPRAPAATVAPAPTPSSTQPSSAPTASATSRVQAAAVSSRGSGTPPAASHSTWIAGALGVALVVALALQVTRVRRHSARRPPP